MRTQFGSKLKLRLKYFGPYQVTKVKPHDRYNVAKIGGHEGTNVTSASADKMKHGLSIAARGLLTTDHVILNHGQVTWMTPELAPLSPNYHTTPTGKRFNSQQI
ncbi:hypothetical protein TNCV_3508721 [Trichonephila clavipes]|nr:hypothetical protein TNCV_3508721 [Trichonephila clavipes]